MGAPRRLPSVRGCLLGERDKLSLGISVHVQCVDFEGRAKQRRPALLTAWPTSWPRCLLMAGVSVATPPRAQQSRLPRISFATFVLGAALGVGLTAAWQGERLVLLLLLPLRHSSAPSPATPPPGSKTKPTSAPARPRFEHPERKRVVGPDAIRRQISAKATQELRWLLDDLAVPYPAGATRAQLKEIAYSADAINRWKPELVADVLQVKRSRLVASAKLAREKARDAAREKARDRRVSFKEGTAKGEKNLDYLNRLSPLERDTFFEFAVDRGAEYAAEASADRLRPARPSPAPSALLRRRAHRCRTFSSTRKTGTKPTTTRLSSGGSSRIPVRPRRRRPAFAG